MPAPLPHADCFSLSYAQARSRFLGAAADARLDVVSHVLPLPGAEGETLAMDAAFMGAADAPSLLIVSSGCHGIEGYAGSAAQLALLQEPAFAALAHERGVAALFIHALNPHGFSWGSRVTQENVDLNRNFLDFGQPLPVNEGYRRIAPLLVPPRWPPPLSNTLAIAALIARHGMRSLQAAVSGGQYEDAQGLFFGGQGPTWSNATLRALLRECAARRRRVGWIDVHTGLGRTGACERILAAPHDPATLARSRAWWGAGITSTEDASSSSAALRGQMWSVIRDECPQAEYTGIALEFGTRSRLEVLQALRGDQWLARHPQAPPALRRAIKQRMRAAFYVETDEWKRSTVGQVLVAAREAVQGLGAAGAGR